MNIYNYNHLYYFYIAAKLNGITVAAKYLRTSQSSLSTQIKTLESMLGKALFKKSGRKIELTPVGKEVYSYCRRAFDVFDEMLDQINSNSFSMGTRISIGVSSEIERPFLTEALAHVSRQYPKDKRPLLNLISLPVNQLQQLLKIRELDLLLTMGVIPDNDVMVIADFELPVWIFAHVDFQKYFKNLSPERVFEKNKIPFVLPSKGTILRSEIDQYLMQKKVLPKCLFESNILSAVVRAAGDGLGVTILPEPYILHEKRRNKIFRVQTKPLWIHRISAITNRGQLDKDKKIFISKLANHMQKHLRVNINARLTL